MEALEIYPRFHFGAWTHLPVHFPAPLLLRSSCLLPKFGVLFFPLLPGSQNSFSKGLPCRVPRREYLETKIPIPNADRGLQLCLKQAGSDLDLSERQVLTSGELHLHLLRDRCHSKAFLKCHHSRRIQSGLEPGMVTETEIKAVHSGQPGKLREARAGGDISPAPRRAHGFFPSLGATEKPEGSGKPGC